MKWLEDQLLSLLQRRCRHPGKFVAADILEGGGGGIRVKCCRRCVAIRVEPTLADSWRNPDPNLWRG